MRPEEKKEIRDTLLSLTKKQEDLEFAHRIPKNVQNAFEKRLGGLRLAVSGHSGETKAVNESGSSSYSVMLPADAFLEVEVNGTTYYIPAFL